MYIYYVWEEIGQDNNSGILGYVCTYIVVQTNTSSLKYKRPTLCTCVIAEITKVVVLFSKPLYTHTCTNPQSNISHVNGDMMKYCDVDNFQTW